MGIRLFNTGLCRPMLVTKMNGGQRMTLFYRFRLILATVISVATASVTYALGPESGACNVKRADGDTNFIYVEGISDQELRRAAAEHLKKSRGVDFVKATSFILECIPPGGAFSDPKVQESWLQLQIPE